MRWILYVFPRVFLLKIGQIIRPILRIIYRGSNYIDPIDSSSYRTFLVYGYGKNFRKNALCPGTLSLERHRLLWLYLRDGTNLLKRKLKVLHFAPAQPLLRQFKRLNNWDYITTDLESPLVDIKANIYDLPFKDESFDLVICNHVLEHIQDDYRAIKELFRILKFKGELIAMVPLSLARTKTYENSEIKSKKLRKIHFGQYDHVRIYGLDYKNRLERVGFEVELIPYGKNLSKKEQEIFRINRNELIPVAKKH
ncbi:MAG: methyltransferase domain-containing protein [Flavobacteriaceae bacterium]|nr:methyltransferase domain-containing protein [Flavobacteriaceae bacterium]